MLSSIFEKHGRAESGLYFPSSLLSRAFKIGVTQAILRSSRNIPVATDKLKICINGLLSRAKQVLITLMIIPS